MITLKTKKRSTLNSYESKQTQEILYTKELSKLIFIEGSSKKELQEVLSFREIWVCCFRTIQASTFCAPHLALYQIHPFGRNENSGVPRGSFSNKLDAFRCNSFLENPY